MAPACQDATRTTRPVHLSSALRTRATVEDPCTPSERRAMLTLTENASTIVRDITAQTRPHRDTSRTPHHHRRHARADVRDQRRRGPAARRRRTSSRTAPPSTSTRAPPRSSTTRCSTPAVDPAGNVQFALGLRPDVTPSHAPKGGPGLVTGRPPRPVEDRPHDHDPRDPPGLPSRPAADARELPHGRGRACPTRARARCWSATRPCPSTPTCAAG